MQYDITDKIVGKEYYDILMAYKEYLLYERSLSMDSVSGYLFHLSKFGDFLGGRIEDATPNDVKDFIKYKKITSMKNSTLMLYVASMRSFYEYLNNSKKSEQLSTLCFFLTNIVRLKREKVVHQVPTWEEVEKIRNVMKEHKELFQRRKRRKFYRILLKDIAIFEMLIATGARSAEIRNLKVSDIDHINQTILVRQGKGGHQRIAIFSQVARDSILEHINHNGFKGNDHVFVMGQGNILNYIIKRWAIRANINPRIHAHSFRHYHITETQRRGVNIQVVADQVGHVNLNSTRYYTHLDLTHRRKEYENCVL